MRVIILSLYPLDLQRISGGVRAVARFLVEGLRSYPDLDLRVVHCHSDVERDLEIVHDGVPVHYLALSRRRVVPNLLRSIPRVRDALRALQPDVVSVHTPSLALGAYWAGVPTLYTCHGNQPVEWWGWRALGDVLRYRLTEALQSAALRRATHLVTISAYAEAAFVARTRARLYRIANPVADDCFGLPEQGAESTAPTLLYAGTISPVKDLVTLVRALGLLRAEVPKVRLEVAGRVNSPGYEQVVKREISELGLASAVQLHGLLDRPSLLAAYARASLVVSASRWENSPVSIAEAMAAAKAVVATRVGGVPELVSEGETGLTVPPGDPAALARACKALLDDPGLRRSMGCRARQVAGERFRIEAVAARYRLALYQTAGRLPPGES